MEVIIDMDKEVLENLISVEKNKSWEEGKW